MYIVRVLKNSILILYISGNSENTSIVPTERTFFFPEAKQNEIREEANKLI